MQSDSVRLPDTAPVEESWQDEGREPMDIVIVAVVMSALGVAAYLGVTRPCKSRIHNHRHWRFRPHRR